MTQHYFENDLVNLHYYKFGGGPQVMLCFHGYGMHGKQFRVLERLLGEKYTFYGFDLFFHKETKLKDQSLENIKRGIIKKEIASLIVDFCKNLSIDHFSVIGYSMGSHYATVMMEEIGEMVDEYIVAAPACLNPGVLVSFFSRNRIGNTILEKLTLSKSALMGLIKICRRLRVVDAPGYQVLQNEIGTAELRFNFYACFTYLRFIGTDKKRLIASLQARNIKSIFIFGKRDIMYPPGAGKDLIAQIKQAEVILLDENHDMINQNFASVLAGLLL